MKMQQKMKPSISSFPFSSCDVFHHLNTPFSFFCEELLFCTDGGGSQKSDEAVQFLNKLLSTQYFLQVSLIFRLEAPSDSLFVALSGL